MGQKMITVIPALFATILMGGCATPPAPYFVTAQEVTFTPYANQTIAQDMAVQIKGTFKPAQTTFWMPAAVAQKSFGQALDHELRNDGYAIGSKPPGIELAYIVDIFSDREVRVRVVAGEDYEVSRLYVQTDDGDLEPEGCFTERSEPMAVPIPLKVSPWAVDLHPTAKLPPMPAAALLIASRAPAKPAVAAAAVASPLATLPKARPGPPARVAPSLTDTHYSIVGPDGDNVITLNENLFIVPVQATDNPFLQLYQPPYKPTDRKLVVLAGIGGPSPTCIVNGEILQEGDHLAGGLKVYRIDPDEIYLERGTFLLKCPVSEDGVTLRLP
jgi:hypothetical protein